jgi:hypothetical protein
MTIKIENPSKMVLKDDRHRRFILAYWLVIAGQLCTLVLSHYLVVPLFAGLGLIGLGLFILLTNRSVTIELDKDTGRVHLLREGARRTEELDLGLSQIHKVVLRQLMQSSTSSVTHGLATARNYYQFTLVFVTDQAAEFPIDFGTVGCGLTNLILPPDQRKREDAARIAQFIGAPLEVSPA